MDFRLVASDYDSTLAPLPASDISPCTARAIREVRARGVQLAVISGRSVAGVRHVIQRQDLELDGIHLLGANGAEIISGVDGTILTHHPIDSELLPQLEAIGRGYGVEVLVHCGQEIHTLDASGYHAQREARVNGMRLVRAVAESLSDLTSERVLLCGDPGRLAVAATAVQAMLPEHVEVHFSAPHLVEVTAAGVDKGHALAELAGFLGIALSETLAFGDNYNDIPLLRTAGRGVAVANAEPDVLAMADDVAPACADDGVAQYLKRVFELAE